MTDTPDASLLEQFTRNNSEAAFGELVSSFDRIAILGHGIFTL
jgi:hypothetical protein